MRRNRKIQLIILITLVSIIGVISVAYAVLSTTLNITGTSEIVSAAWNIYFSNVQVTNVGENVTISEINFTETKISDYNVTLNKPGDKATLVIYIANESDMPAEVTSIINSTPVCTSSTGNTADADLVCNNLVYEYTLSDGTQLEVGDILIPGIISDYSSEFCRFDEMGNPLESTIYLTIGFSEEADAVPSSNVTISNLSNEIIFTQSDENSCGGGSSEGPTITDKITISYNKNDMVVTSSSITVPITITTTANNYPYIITTELYVMSSMVPIFSTQHNLTSGNEYTIHFDELSPSTTYDIQVTVTSPDLIERKLILSKIITS